MNKIKVCKKNTGIKNVKRLNSRFCATLLTAALICQLILPSIASASEGFILDDDVKVRSGPGTDYSIITSLNEKDLIEIIGTEFDENGNQWYAVNFGEMTGYVFSEYVSQYSVEYSNDDEQDENIDNEEIEDDIFLEDDLEEADDCEEDVSENETPENDTSELDTSETEETETDIQEEKTTDLTDESETEEGSYYEFEEEWEDDSDIIYAPQFSGNIQSESEFEAQLSQFPESYQASLRAIHEIYPNYTFAADYIDMDFQELVDYQIGKKVDMDYADSWKAMYDESFGWYENYDWDEKYWYSSEGNFTYASRELTAYAIDPRNFLDTTNIYMFMRQSYSDSLTLDDVRSLIDDSFLERGYKADSSDPEDAAFKGDYAAVLMEAGRQSGTSPFVLAVTILLEQGWAGKSPLITGYYEADDGTIYKNYFNFYNIGATGSDNNNVIQNGLEYAKRQGWFSRYKSIVEGAKWTTDSYINNGQDTYYYKQFNVINGWDELWHQYSTSVMASVHCASLLRNAVADNNLAALEFRIPVYQNMPSEPSEKPAYNNKLNNYYFTDINVSGLSPSYTKKNHYYSLNVDGNTTINVSLPETAIYEGNSTYSLSSGTNTINLSVRSETGYLRTYVIAVNASKNCTITINIGSSSNDAYNKGDVNGDGKVSALDYIQVKNHIMGTKTISNNEALAAADFNGDGKVSALDYIAIKKHIMSK